jgi:hypothetical protein
MVQTVGQLLPLAVCIALSTVPIIVTITLLLGPRSRGSSLGFLLGWVIGMFLVVTVLYLLASALPATTVPSDRPVVGWVEIAIGLALIAYGVVAFIRHPKQRPEGQLPRWISAIGTVRPITAFGLALVLCLRPKALLISIAASLVVAGSSLGFTASLIVFAIFVGIGAATVLVPVVVSLARPDAMKRPLQGAQGWISRNSRTVTTVAVLIVGTVIVGHGMTEL